MLTALALVLALPLSGAPAPPPGFLALEPAPKGAPPLLYCTPEGQGIVGGEFQRGGHPVVRALAKAEPGSTVFLEEGQYPPFTLGLGSNAWDNADISGGQPGAPIVLDGRGRATIVGREQDTIGIDQRQRVAHVTFRGLKIVTGRRSGVMFYKRTDAKNHVGFRFEDCEINGGYQHPKASGRFSKWGVWAHSLVDFSFVGTLEPARVFGIRDEHAFYIQNPQGNVLIDNVEARGLGRTFVQLTCRRRDGPPGKGFFVVRRCDVANVGLAPDDLYQGGTAFSIGGRHTGQILFERNKFRAGFDPRLKRLKPVGGVHGTGAFVAWQGGERVRNGTLVLKDNDFQMAYGCGDRALVAISGCESVQLLGRNQFRSGGFQPALALEPRDDSGKPDGEPNLLVSISPRTVFEGEFTYRNEALDEAGRARFLAREPDGDEADPRPPSDGD